MNLNVLGQAVRAWKGLGLKGDKWSLILPVQ